MPHTKLKVTDVILIIYGAGSILGGLAILAAALLAGEEAGVKSLMLDETPLFHVRDDQRD